MSPIARQPCARARRVRGHHLRRDPPVLRHLWRRASTMSGPSGSSDGARARRAARELAANQSDRTDLEDKTSGTTSSSSCGRFQMREDPGRRVEDEAYKAKADRLAGEPYSTRTRRQAREMILRRTTAGCHPQTAASRFPRRRPRERVSRRGGRGEGRAAFEEREAVPVAAPSIGRAKGSRRRRERQPHRGRKRRVYVVARASCAANDAV